MDYLWDILCDKDFHSIVAGYLGAFGNILAVGVALYLAREGNRIKVTGQIYKGVLTGNGQSEGIVIF